MGENAARRWDRIWTDRAMLDQEPNPFLLGLMGGLPRSGRALDVGGGAGRHAIPLAVHGLDVSVVDVSPVGLAAARRAAEAAGVEIRTMELDLEREPLPDGPWDVVADLHFLHRPLFEEFPRVLAPGGILVFAHATLANLARNPRPGRRWLLGDGELPGLVHGMEIVLCREGWTDWGRCEAHLVARRGG